MIARILFLTLWAAVSLTSPLALASAEPLPDIDTLGDAVTCGSKGCHTRIRKEWASTMHASSTADKDPLIKAFYNYLDERDVDTDKCNSCHSPLKAIYKDTKEHPIFNEGVTCVFCHSVYGLNNVTPGIGHQYYKFDLSKSAASPYRPSSEAAHDTDFIGLFRSVDICAGCHREGETDFIVTNKRKMICQSCHMPSKKNSRSADDSEPKEKVYRHLFEGGHSQELLSLAVTLHNESTEVVDGKTILNLTLESGAYHAIPTGFPFRSIYVSVVAKNDRDEIIWQNYKESPYSEDPGSFFGRVYKADEEIYAHHVKPLKPIWIQQLPPKEAFPLSYEVSSADVAYFEVKVFYRLLSDRIIKTLNLPSDSAPETLMVEGTVYVE